MARVARAGRFFGFGLAIYLLSYLYIYDIGVWTLPPARIKGRAQNSLQVRRPASFYYELRLLSSCVRARHDHKSESPPTCWPARKEGEPRRATVDIVIFMPVSTRRHPDDSVERALEDAQPSLENDAKRSPSPPAPAAMPGEPLRHRIRRRLPQWRAAGAPPHVLRWIEEGVACEWINGPPPPYNYGGGCCPPIWRARFLSVD